MKAMTVRLGGWSGYAHPFLLPIALYSINLTQYMNNKFLAGIVGLTVASGVLGGAGMANASSGNSGPGNADDIRILDVRGMNAPFFVQDRGDRFFRVRDNDAFIRRDVRLRADNDGFVRRDARIRLDNDAFIRRDGLLFRVDNDALRRDVFFRNNNLIFGEEPRFELRIRND